MISLRLFVFILPLSFFAQWFFMFKYEMLILILPPFEVYHHIIRLNCVWNVFIAQLHSDGVSTTEHTKQCTSLIIMQFNKFSWIEWNKNCGGIHITKLKIKSHKIKWTHCTQIDKNCKKIMFSQMYQLLPFKPNKFIYLDGIKCQNTE